MMQKPCSKMSAACVALLAVVTLAPLTGCYGPYTGREDRLPIEEYPNIVASRGTYKNLYFGPATIEEGTPEQPMRVTVPVRSRYRYKNLNIQYRFEFLDYAGRPIERSGQREWRFITLEPRNQVFLDANALDTGAKDWRLQVRLAQ